MMHVTKPFQVRAYVREGITRLPVDVQKHEIQKAADSLELKVEWYTSVALKDKTAIKERDLWARQLRSDEVGMVHSLPVLRLTRKQIGGADPKADFAGFMASIDALYLMEASTGTTSKDKAKWRGIVTVVTEKRPPGSRALTKEEAKRVATVGWETRNRGVVATWKSDARIKERKHLIRHWLASATAKTALATLPEFVDEMNGGVYVELNGISLKTLERICDTKRK